MDILQTIRIQIPPAHAGASEVISFLSTALQRFIAVSIPEKDPFSISHFRLALDESLLNAIDHGCKNDKSGIITILARFDAHIIEVTVEDPGNGFHSDSIKMRSPKDFEKILTRGLQKSKGWGLAIIQSVAHCVFWNDRGNRITFVFYR